MTGKDISKRIWVDDDILDAESDFLRNAGEFSSMLDEMLLDPVLRIQIDGHLDFTRKIWKLTYGGRLFTGEPLVMNYYMVSRISREVALAEYVSIQYILEH